MMHAQDESLLTRICSGRLSAETVAEYELMRRGWQVISSGPMPVDILLVIARASGGIKQAEKPKGSRLSNVPMGTFVRVLRQTDRTVKFEGVLVGVGSGMSEGMATVAIWGQSDQHVPVVEDAVECYPPGFLPEWFAIERSRLEQTPGLQEPVEFNREFVPATPPAPEPDPEPAAQENEQEKPDLSTHPFFRVEVGTKLIVSSAKQGLINGWYKGLTDDGLVIVRTERGPRKDRDKRYGFGNCAIAKDDTGVPVIDMEGMLAAGPEVQDAVEVNAG